MLFIDPQPTPYDVRFRLFDVPGRVHPFFWLLALFGAGTKARPAEALIWVATVFLSILVHEFGHVAAFLYYRIRSHVVLYSFGGLAIPTFGGGRLGPRQQIVVSFAGPAAGFLFAGVLILGLWMSGVRTQFVFGLPFLFGWYFTDPSGLPASFPNAHLGYLLYGLLYVNIYWGLVNLLPIYPLDGGQISRAAFELSRTPDGLRKSLIVSLIAAIAMALYGLRMESFFSMFLFGYMAYGNYQELQSLRYGRRW